MKPNRVFVSHSSADKQFADLVVAELRVRGFAPWIDSEQIIAGDDILDRLGDGLRKTDTLVFLISQASLSSQWVDREVKYTAFREVSEKLVLIVPFIIDDTALDEVPWFLTERNISRVAADAGGAAHIVDVVQQKWERHSVAAIESCAQESGFASDSRIDDLIKHVGIGDWVAARDVAVGMLGATDEMGDNELFEALLRYLDCPDQDLLFAAILTIESFLQLAPWLADRELLTRMASHRDFSVRSSAASICFDLAHFAPESVPIDILLSLSSHDEDWYVRTPATSALKAIGRWRPTVLRVFFLRLHSSDPDIREYAAHALSDIASEEPEILDPEEFSEELAKLKEVHDDTAAYFLEEALSKMGQAERGQHYRYSAF